MQGELSLRGLPRLLFLQFFTISAKLQLFSAGLGWLRIEGGDGFLGEFVLGALIVLRGRPLLFVATFDGVAE